MKYANDRYTFASGRSIYANNGIIGIRPDLEISEGYDGGIPGQWPDSFLDDGSEPTPADFVELADAMIEMWQAFRAKWEAQR